MSIIITLITDNTRLIETFEKKFQIIINKAIQDIQTTAPVTYSPFSVNPKTTQKNNFVQEILKKSSKKNKTIDGIVVIYEEKFSDFITDFENALCSGLIENVSIKTNYQNLLNDSITKILKNYLFLRDLMLNKKYLKRAILPLKNFTSQVQLQLQKCCRNGFLIDYKDSVNTKFSDMKKKHLRENSFIDDEGFCYIYGDETHSQYETGTINNHNEICDLNGKFRFGFPLEPQKHFNVTQTNKTHITCCKCNCHGAEVRTTKKTHINMFSNDFHS